METQDYTKPLPEPTQESMPFWDGLKHGKLMFQCCAACGKVRHYPRPVCPHCYSMDTRWQESKGRGVVHSWTITHHAFNPGFKADLPLVLVTVDLEDGVRMQAQLRGSPVDALKIGFPVRIAYEQATKELTLPVFVAA